MQGWRGYIVVGPLGGGGDGVDGSMIVVSSGPRFPEVNVEFDKRIVGLEMKVKWEKSGELGFWKSSQDSKISF